MIRAHEQIRPPVGADPARARLRSDAPEQSLDGLWRFRYSTRAEDIAEPTDAGADWAQLPVPSHWQLHGYGAPAYTNQNYPFPLDVPHVPDENPTGEYRTGFTHPGWADGRVLLRFDGVDSWFSVWLNGVHIGDASGSRLVVEFDVTDALDVGQNLLAVRVHQWSFGSYVEDQDQWWLSGIFRPVSLLHRPLDGIDDVFIHADYEDGIGSLEVEVSGPDVEIEIEELGLRVRPGERVEVPVEPWTAETPRLYEVVVRNAAETVRVRTGFRTVTTAGGVFRVNGEPVTFRGVNRHDFDPERGRAVTMESMEADVLLMKQHNINAVRTAHYPPHPYLLDLCDRHGLWVIDENDIETHGFNFIGWKGNPSDDPRFAEVYLDRMRRTLERDKNHPSIVMWSLGNEAGWGRNMQAIGEWAKTRDPARPIHYEQDAECRVADVYSRMYATFDEVEAIGAGVEPRLADAKSDERRRGLPMIQCEYAHAMGNGPGGIDQYERIFDTHPRLAGGFVWEWFDHGLKVVRDDGVVSYRYGGDFGEVMHDGSYVIDGLLLPDRTPSPGLTELAAAIAPVRVTPTQDGFLVENRTSFTATSSWMFLWSVAVDGAEVAAGSLDVPTLGPGESAVVATSIPATEAFEGRRGLVLVDVLVVLAGPASWAPAGHVVSRGQWVVRDDAPVAAFAAAHGVVSRRADGWSAGLTQFGADGVPTEILGVPVSHFALDVWRAPIENDLHAATGEPEPLATVWRKLGLDRVQERTLSVQGDAGELVVHKRMMPAVLDVGFDVEYRWRGDDDAIDLDIEIIRRGDWRFPLPRLGILLGIPHAEPGSVRSTWLGSGPGESYPDSERASRRGLFSSTVREMQTDYVVPQENGARPHARRVELDLDHGGVEILGRTPFVYSVRPWSDRALEKAAHADELREEGTLWVHLDAGVTGLGSATVGPGPQGAASYTPSSARLALTFRRTR